MEATRCPWCLGHPEMQYYHDHEWGVPVHDDRLHYEYLVLDAFQAGLSWRTILLRRPHFARAFAHYNIQAVATYDDNDLARLMTDPGIIRNRQKIQAAIANARALLRIQEVYGSFDTYIWQFTNGSTLHNSWQQPGQVPATSPQSDAMSKDMKKRGFSFVGSTICYAYMQAAGMVNDHLTGCYRYHQLLKEEL